MQSKEAIKKEWVKMRTQLLSEMLDRPNEDGIFPTGKFYNAIDHYFEYFLDKYASQFQSPPPSKDVEAKAKEEARKHFDKIEKTDGFCNPVRYESFKDGFILGAKWAEQAKEGKWEKAWNKLYEDFKKLDEYNTNLREENKRYKNVFDKIVEQAKEVRGVTHVKELPLVMELDSYINALRHNSPGETSKVLQELFWKAIGAIQIEWERAQAKEG